MLKAILLDDSAYSFFNKRLFLKYSVKSTLSKAEAQELQSEVNLKSFEDIPGPRSYPFIGTVYKYLPFIGEYSVDTLDKNAWLNYRRYGSLVRENPGIRLLHVYDPDNIETVLRQDTRPARRSHTALGHYRLSKPDTYNTGGLLNQNGPEWWRIRSAFQKNFSSPQAVKAHVTTVDGIAKEFLQFLKDINYKSNEDLLPYLNRLNLEIIGAVAFNERFNSLSRAELASDSHTSRIIEAAFGSNNNTVKLDNSPFWKYFKTPLYKSLVKSQEHLEKVTDDILLKTLTFFPREEPGAAGCLLDSFLLQPEVDIKDVRGMMVDILMGAIDTTAYTMSFLLYHLARNPDVQQTLFSEVSRLQPSRQDALTAALVGEASYARACIRESLRLNPVSVGVGRLLQKDVVLNGYLIPKGTVIVTENMVSSRLAQHAPAPLAFRPERRARLFASLPFGHGARMCVARRLAEQNLAIVLIRLIREFEVKWTGGELGVRTVLINKPDKPITIEFVPRNS